MNLVDRDELLSRMVALRHANCDSGVQRIALCNAFIAILEAMPVMSCYTCHYGDDHMFARCSACRCGDMWAAIEEML